MANIYKYKNARQEWLNQHGGRNESDVMMDNDGQEYVVMVIGHNFVEVYLPQNCQRIKRTYPHPKNTIRV